MKIALSLLSLGVSLFALVRSKASPATPATPQKPAKPAPAPKPAAPSRTVKPEYISTSEALGIFNSATRRSGGSPFKTTGALSTCLRLVFRLSPLDIGKKELFWAKQDVLAAAELRAQYTYNAEPPEGAIPTSEAYKLYCQHAVPGALKIACTADFYGKALPHISPVCKYKKSCYWFPQEVIAFATLKTK